MKITRDNLHMYCTECGECLLWNQGVNSTGYPQANIDSKPGQMVRRHVFTNLLGKTLKAKERVATRCGNKLCLAEGCLYAETYGRTLSRAYKDGRRMGAMEYARRLEACRGIGMAKLDWEKVTAIRQEPESRSHQSIATELGLSHKTISQVRRYVTWKTQHAAASVFNWRPQ
jgi:hypothetical protein